MAPAAEGAADVENDGSSVGLVGEAGSHAVAPSANMVNTTVFASFVNALLNAAISKCG